MKSVWLMMTWGQVKPAQKEGIWLSILYTYMYLGGQSIVYLKTIRWNFKMRVYTNKNSVFWNVDDVECIIFFNKFDRVCRWNSNHSFMAPGT